MTHFKLLMATAIAATLVGCTTLDPYTGEEKTSSATRGALIGAGVGALAGILTGDDSDERRKRALIGAGVGALTGTAIGSYMDEQEAELREELAGTGVSISRQGDELLLNMPSNITFATNQHDVKAQFYPVLDSVGKVLTEYDQTLVDVIGHTDSTGSDAINQPLSERRASSVASYLQARNVDPLRIAQFGVGSSQPVASNQTTTGRGQNRRVEIKLVPLTR